MQFSGALRSGTARRLIRLISLALLIAASSTVLSSSPAHAEELEVRLRIAWGGGDARSWVGSIAMSRGELSQPKLLGLEADEPGSIYLDQGILRIDSPSERSYAGVDLTLRGPAEAEVAIDLRGREGLDSGLQFRIPFEELISEVQASRLDDRGNQLVARRAPGDKLRIEFERDSLVFDPGEAFAFEVHPHETGLAPGASYTVRLRLSPARKTEEIWSQEFRVTADDQGNLSALEALELDLPAGEGAYDLVATVHPWQFTSAIRRPKPTLSRKLQLIVIDPQPPAAPQHTAWNAAAFEIDPANPTWWDRLPRWSLSNIWPSFSQGPITSGPAQKRTHLDHTWIELPAEAWQAYPLGIGDPGQLHMLEIEYPSDVPQRLGISIVEPNAAGKVTPIGLDSGVEVTGESVFVEGKVVRHRLMFWPRSESPLVLLTNRSEQHRALFGKIRVLHGPDGLAPLQLKAGTDVQSPRGGRLLTAYFDKPLFPENFSATSALDTGSGRSLDDWKTFHEGGRRLVEYLKHMGYNGAMISVSCEGGTIYPSGLLSPTPKYDNGAFFVSGQDPLQKDVLEMLMRMFDREGLTLVPAMQFATPLPKLEAIRREADADTLGLEWIDHRGQRLLASGASHEGLAPYYNPLHPTVQAAMKEVVEEVSGRYREHSSFGGIALQVGPYSYARLPGTRWGFDDTTLAAYQAETGQVVEASGADRFSQRANLLLGAQRQQWIRWRANRMASFYEELGKAATADKPQAKFYLSDVNLLADPEIRHAIGPGLPRRQSLPQVMLQQGIDLELLQASSQVEVMRPRRKSSEQSVTRSAATLEMNEADDIKRFYEKLQVTTSLSHAEPDILRLPAFDQASPYGPTKTFTRLVSQFSPSEAGRRRSLVKTLAEGDKLTLSEGGWMLPLGQEHAVRDLFATWRSLPPAPFETLAAGRMKGTADGSLIVRRLQQDGKTYLYLLNNTPWPITAKLEMAIAPSTPLQAVGPRSVPALKSGAGGQSAWNVPLEAYDLVAAVFSTSELKVTSRQIETAPRVKQQLRSLVLDTDSRNKAIQKVAPLDVLENPSFEAPPLPDEPIARWVYSNGGSRGGAVKLESANPHNGGQCLVMENSRATAWLRSAPLDPPTTGRIAILVWLRTTSEEDQPRVHLSLDYDFGSDHRYEFRAAGKGTGNPMRKGWSPYVANFDELPVEKVSDLRVGIDVMSAGTVWVDDVEVFDSRFEPSERNQLTKIWALANFYLQEGRLGDCYQILSGYWPRFLRETIELPPEVATLPSEPEATPAKPAPAPEPPQEEPRGFFDRVKSYSPTKWNPFR